MSAPDPTMKVAANWETREPKGKPASQPTPPARSAAGRSRQGRQEPHEPPQPELVIRTFADIEPKDVEWLWPDRIPLGMITMLDGDPGVGKSLITVALAAAVSTGKPMPGGDPAQPADVLFLAAEDDPSRVIRQRLELAGADLTRVHIIDEIQIGDRKRPVSFPEDLSLLEKMIRERGVRLMIVDPITAYLNGGVDSHKDQDVRFVLSDVKSIAERTGTAILMVRHLNKVAGSAAIYRGGGSIAFTAAARSALIVGRHPDDSETCVLAVTKSNLAARSPALCYTVASQNNFPMIEWGEECELTADELVAEPVRPKREKKRNQCEEWLRKTLENGEILSDILEEQAKAAGFSHATLKRTADAIGVRKRKDKGQGGKWFTSLPAEPEPNGNDKHGSDCKEQGLQTYPRF